jgi:hypothetical protein
VLSRREPIQRPNQNGCCPVLDLGMAIRAQKDALARLGPQRLKRERHALGVDRVPLLRRLDLMEMKRSHARTASLLDEDRLHSSASAGYGFRSAPLAPVS